MPQITKQVTKNSFSYLVASSENSKKSTDTETANFNRNITSLSSSDAFLIERPTSFEGVLQPHYKENTLVVPQQTVGYLQEVNSKANKAIFVPLPLPKSQREKAISLLSLRDAYLDLYHKGATTYQGHLQERQILNNLYDDFVKNYGHLNTADNIKLIKTDISSAELPYLERCHNGVYQKADIFLNLWCFQKKQ